MEGKVGPLLMNFVCGLIDIHDFDDVSSVTQIFIKSQKEIDHRIATKRDLCIAEAFIMFRCISSKTIPLFSHLYSKNLEKR